MADDYYEILEVPRGASSDDIQKAYRGLARKYHPDLNPDDKTAKSKFQNVQKAFETLNDPEKRKLYDQFGPAYEQMGSGGPGPRPGPGGQAWGGGGGMPEGFEGIDLSSLFGMGGDDEGGGGIFEQLRGRGRGKRARCAPAEPGADRHQNLVIPFTTAVLGGHSDVTIPRPGTRPESLSVKIPPGIHDGGKIRLRGQGDPGLGDGPAGDLLLTIRIAPHPAFTRHEDNLEVRLPISLQEAVQGAKVDVPTPYGTISLKIPPRTSSGVRLRVKGRGVKAKDGASGDLFAVVQIMLPENVPEDLIEAIEKLPASNPRAELRW
ncbi:MAG: J domain-containing protein [Pirellulales bacterium]